MRLEEDKDYLNCDYCRSMYFPEANDDGVRVLGEPAYELCPVCEIPLVHAAVGGQRILHCGRCRGILLAVPVFVQLIDDLRAHHDHASAIARPLNPKDLERTIRCPRCHGPMDTHPYGGPGNIVLDTCENCFLHWLDYGELQRIVRAPDYCHGGESLLA
jgi:Zn-finger nucleic acid-binding protein